MMNKGLIASLSFVCGAVSGGIGVYIYMKKWADEKIATEIGRFKAEYRGGVIAKWENKKKEASESAENGEKAPSYIMKTSIDGGPVEHSNIEYHKMSASYRKSEADLAAFEHPEDDNPVENADEKAKYEYITVEQYEDDEEFDKHEFVWYLLDDVIVDEFGEEVEDRDILTGNLLGEGFRDELFNEPDGMMNVYVRNNSVNVDYCVEIERDLSYEDTINQK
jgi:hypothetical protein